MPSEHHPHIGRITGDLSLPLVIPHVAVIWPLKTVTVGMFSPAELAVFLVCRIGDRPRFLCHPGGCGTDHITAPHRERTGTVIHQHRGRSPYAVYPDYAR